MKRLWEFFAVKLWLVGYGVLALLTLAHNGEGQVPKLSLAAPVVKIEPWRNEIFPYAQPRVYDDWWHEIAQCEGLALVDGYKQVQFFGVNAEEFMPLAWPIQTVYAVTYAGENQIFMAQPLIWESTIPVIGPAM